MKKIKNILDTTINRKLFKLPPFKTEPFMSIEGQIMDWGLKNLGVDKVWQLTQGEGVRILVIDTGMPNHVDLKPNLMPELCFDATGEGKEDHHGHSTFVSSIICASGDGIGAYGYAPKAKFATAKALSSKGTGDMNWATRCLQFALDNSDKFDMINMSLGAPVSVLQQHNLIKELVKKGKIIFCASGNYQRGQTKDTITYPAAYPETIAIGAYDMNGNIASFSSWGKEVDFAFPGVDNIGCGVNGGYVKMSGTSFACPAALGTAALLMAYHKKIGDGDCQNTEQIVKKFINASIDKGAPGVDNKWGHGMVNVYKLFESLLNK